MRQVYGRLTMLATFPFSLDLNAKPNGVFRKP